MKANYHTHTPLCRHAWGSEEEYIQKAIKEGLEILGFSDHAPHVFATEDFDSPARMKISQIGQYFETLLALREKYKDYIQILIGFETEYYPLLWKKTRQVYKNYPLDYLILGNHQIGNESISALNSFSATKDESTLKSYVDYCIAACETGKISFIAHPDVINFVGDGETYLREMTRLIKKANELALPLEINMYGLRENRAYPRADFWTLAGDLGATAILGCDCHRIEHVADRDEIKQAQEYAARFGLNIVDKIDLRSPF